VVDVKKWDVTAALKKSKLPATARHVMLWLIDAAEKETCRIPVEFTPSLTELSGWSGITRSTVAEHLTYLERLGWVKRFRPTVAAARSEKAKTQYKVLIGVDPESRPDVVLRPRKAEKTSPLSGLVREADQSSSPPGGPELVRSADQASPLSGPELVRQADTIPPPPFTPQSPPVANRSGSLRDEGQRDGEPGLFGADVIPPKPESEGQRINRLARIYTDRLPLSSFMAVQGVVRTAATAGGYSDDQITAGLNRLADEPGRPVTANTLRIAIEGLPTRQPAYAGPGNDTHSRDYSGGII
jgi:hypothetical protein